MLDLMTTNKASKMVCFIVAVTLFYLLNRSLMFFVDLFSIFVNGGGSEYRYLPRIIWDIFSYLVVSIFLFMLIGPMSHSFYRGALICTLVYFVLDYLVKLHFLFSNRHIIADDHLYWRTFLVTCIVLVPYILLVNLKKIILIYNSVKIFCQDSGVLRASGAGEQN